MMKRKQVDDVLGGDSAWENVDRTLALGFRFYLFILEIWLAISL